VLEVLKVRVLKVLPVLMVLGVSMAQTPAPQPRDGVITGQVVDAASGKPVGAAIVQTGGGAPLGGRTGGGSVPPPRILTGSDGRFLFRDLPLGGFTIVVTKGGYSEGASGRRVVGGPSQPVVLTAAQRTADVTVRIWKNAAITGAVVDEAGEPVVALQVRAARRTITGGRRRFVPSGAAVTTDDRGMYRLSGLPPGDYLIATSQPPLSASTSAFADARTGRSGGAELASVLGPPGTVNGIQVGEAQLMIGRGGAIPPPPVRGRMQIYPPIFYPSALAPAQAMTIALAAGEERIGVDLQLQPVATVRVTGTLMGPSGPAGLVALRLVPTGVEEIASEVLAPVSVSDAAGAFTFAAVPQGRYSLRGSSRIVTGPPRGGDAYDLAWLNLPIAVSGDDVDGVLAVMRPSLHITARLEFEGAPPRPTELPQVRFVGAPFSLESDDNLPSGTGGFTGGTGGQGFTLGGYAPGK